MQDIVGREYTFLKASADGTACSFQRGTNLMVISFRDGGQEEFDASLSGAAITGDVEEFGDICHGTFVANLQDAILIIEGLNIERELIFNITMSGVADFSDVDEFDGVLGGSQAGLILISRFCA